MNGYLDNLRPFEKRMVVGVGAMVFVVLNFWFVVPHFSDWGRVQGRMAKARITREKFQSEIDKIPTYNRRVKELESEGAAVPAEEAAIHFSTAIRDQQVKSGVNITRTGRQTTKTNQFFLEQTQPISVVSKEPELVNFLYNLGEGNSLIRVRALTLRPDQPRHDLNAEVTLVASYQKNPSKSAPAPVQTPAIKSPAPAAKPAPPVVKSTPPNNATAPAIKGPAPGIKSANTTNKLATTTTKRP